MSIIKSVSSLKYNIMYRKAHECLVHSSELFMMVDTPA